MPTKKPAGAESTTFEIDFTHGRDYRVVHADGAWGGLTPSGGINVAFYAEWKKEPTSIIYEASDNKLRETKRNGPEHVTREIQVEVLMTQAGAQALYKWLRIRLSQAESLKGSGFEITEDPS